MERTSLADRLLVPVGGLAGWGLVWGLCSLLRYQVEGWHHFTKLKQAATPVIFSFWHNQILCATYFWRFRKIAVMTSQHGDGEYIARIISRFGYIPARGSSGRGGTRALLQLKRHLAGGHAVAFTVDGPTGPLHKVKPGPLWLSMKTGIPILPFHIQPERLWEGSGWDGFHVPIPCSRVLVKIGRPFVVPPDSDAGDWVSVYQERMDALTAYCNGYVWGSR